ncbi:MAG: hypothetical protein IMY67_12440, partial [Bacteroidetes bacterium]|nr:hypothetical protein [Bacteroidota bacterium]
MTQKTKGIILWIVAMIFTLGIAVYQRTTGPTYPASGVIEFNNHKIDYKLLRSANSDAPATIKLDDIPQRIEAVLHYRRFKTDEPLKQVDFMQQETDLIALLPAEPPAGKLEYT